MTEQFRQLEFKTQLNSPADEVYRAFIHPTALRDWFCNAAQVDPRPGGRLYFYWNEGFFTTGAFTQLEPGKTIQYTWQGKGEAAATQIQVTLTAEGSQTSLALVHAGIPASPDWDASLAEYQKGWESGLENLQSLLETGIDLRDARRPMMGIFIGEFTPEVAARAGVPVTAGVFLEGCVDGMGAQAAGLQKGDVLVRMAGQEVDGYNALGPIIRKHKAGDEVEVSYYRGAELKTAALKFAARTFPKLPATAAALAKTVKKDFNTFNQELAKHLAGRSEAELEKRPAQDAWNAKENLAHLIQCERDQQTWIADMLLDHEIPDSLEYSPNVLPRLQALVAVYSSLPQLMTELKRCQKETIALLASLPDKFVARKHVYNRIARWYLEEPEHLREHLTQIDAVLPAR